MSRCSCSSGSALENYAERLAAVCMCPMQCMLQVRGVAATQGVSPSSSSSSSRITNSIRLWPEACCSRTAVLGILVCSRLSQGAFSCSLSAAAVIAVATAALYPAAVSATAAGDTYWASCCKPGVCIACWLPIRSATQRWSAAGAAHTWAPPAAAEVF